MTYLKWGGSTDRSTTVGTTSTRILARNVKRIFATFTNIGVTDIHIALGRAATTTTGLLLVPNGVFTIDKNTPWLDEVYAISSANCAISGEEVEE